MSLLVDAVGDVVEVPADAFERPPETMRPEEKELLHGVYKLDGHLLLVLDLDRVLAMQSIL